MLVGCQQHNNADCIALCGDDRVMIVDMAKSNDTVVNVVWDWKTAELVGQLSNAQVKALYPTDECKIVDKGRKLLITSSRNAVLLLDIATKHADFFASAPMAHSAEILPNNRIAVALSTNVNGNALEIFDIDHPEEPIFRDSLFSGHGVVWNRWHKSLYTLNWDELREYKLRDWNSENAWLERVNTWKTPAKSGHDLSMADEDRLLLTGHNGVFCFDIRKETFEPFAPLEKVKNVKSVNYNPKNGRLVYTVAEESWWTHHVYEKNPDRYITIADLNIYKARFH